MDTYLHLPRLALIITVTILPLGPLPIARSNPVPLLDTHPPQAVQVLPALAPQLLHLPRPPVGGVLLGRVQRLVLAVEEVPQAMVRIRHDLRELLAVDGPGQRLIVHGEHLARARAPDRGQAAVAVVVAVPAALVKRGGRGEEAGLLLARERRACCRRGCRREWPLRGCEAASLAGLQGAPEARSR